MEEKSLLARLMARFTAVCHNKSSQIKKSVIALTLAIGTVLSVSACSPTDLGNTPGGIIGGITNPGSGIGQDGERHSSIFLEATSWEKDFSNYYSNPLTFLQSQGYSLDSIKNGTSPCETTSFIKEDEPNSLYMYTRVQHENSNYSTYYLLKYHITNLEKSDYIYLRDSGFQQAIHLNSEIDKTREPEIINTISLTEKTEQSIVNFSNTKNFDKYIDLTTNNKNVFKYRLPYSIDLENSTLTMLYRTSSNTAAKNNTISLITVQLNKNATQDPNSVVYLSSSNGIYDGEATSLCTWPNKEDVDTFILEDSCLWSNYLGERNFNTEFSR